MILSIFIIIIIILNARKLNFIKNAFDQWGMLMQTILVKLTLYVTENQHFISRQNPIKVKNAQKDQTISIPYLLQAQPALGLVLLACYCGSTTICRWNDNCVDRILRAG